MEETEEVPFNVYAGSESGALKGVYLGDDTVRVSSVSCFNSDDEKGPVKSLCWSDDSNKEIIVALNRKLKFYNTKMQAFTKTVELDLDDTKMELVKAVPYESNVIFGLENGQCHIWNLGGDRSEATFRVGSHISCFQQCASTPSLFVTGGKENDVKIWNLQSERPEEPMFRAKNLPHVYELRLPVWVQDGTFLPQTTDVVAVCTRYGQLRLYDANVDNRNRPLINMEFCDHPLMSISNTRNDRQVLVGSAQGKVGLVDIRNPKEKLVKVYRGFNGSVRSIQADENSPYFVSCTLDKCLFLHSLESKQPLKRMNLKSKLTNVLITKKFLCNAKSQSKRKCRGAANSNVTYTDTLKNPKRPNVLDIDSKPRSKINKKVHVVYN